MPAVFNKARERALLCLFFILGEPEVHRQKEDAMKRKLDTKLLGRLILDLDLSKKEIDAMSRDEMFRALLEYEGIMGYDDWIKELVLQVYGIDLNNWPEYLNPENAAEMQGTEEY